MTDWNIDKAREMYAVDHWGAGYFNINRQGHCVVCPDAAANGSIDMEALCRKLTAAGLRLPVLARFTGILRHRVDELHRAFSAAIQSHAYENEYTAVYPIKVNQQRSVVEAILDHHHVGLEVGSKPELLAVLALADKEHGVIVCNGYKDREYIRLALIGNALGHKVFIVVEKLSELELVIEQSHELDIAPLIGVRMRLASLAGGKWQNTGGEKSKFGLSAKQVLKVIARLRESGHLSALAMMHFHMGSQIANIDDIAVGMQEAARYYAELREHGAPITHVNAGGGMGIDYEGTCSRGYFSTNYSIRQYAETIVAAIATVCNEQRLPHPQLITEAGRAMTAHHAVLITDVVDVEPVAVAEQTLTTTDDDGQIILQLSNILDKVDDRTAIECFHDVSKCIANTHRRFSQGQLSLSNRARAEDFYYAICLKIRDCLSDGVRAHRQILDELNEKLADKYFCNFSLFQSLPDSWAIDQLFPIVPLYRLDEFPERRGVIVDITCDSDGRINHYVDANGTESSLPLHRPLEGKPYVLGIFLVGAYQEILGDMHNLFGDTDSVNVELLNGEISLQKIEQGDDVASVLRYVRFEPKKLLESYKAKIGSAENLSENHQRLFLEELAAGLQGYTYLED